MEALKKYKLFMFGFCLLGLLSCNESGKEDDYGKVITPTEQKTRLKDVGVEFVEAINAKTHENLVQVAAYIDDNLSDLDIDEAYLNKLDGLYTETGGDDYSGARKANPIEAIRGLMALSLDVAQNGSQLATRADDIYMYTLKAGLKDLYGGFKPYGDEWQYNASITDRLEVEFTDNQKQKWVATLKGSNETARVHLTGENIYSWKSSDSDGWSYEDYDHGKFDVSIDVPKLITLTVKCDQEEVVNLIVNSSLAFEADVYDNYSSNHYYGYNEEGYYYYYDEYTSEFKLDVDYTNLNLNASLNVNGYVETWVTTASKSNLKSTAEIKIDGRSMIKAEAALNADVDALIKAINDANTYSGSSSSDDEDDDNYYDFDAKALKDFSMSVDVMGKVQLRAKCDKFESLYDALIALEKADDQDDFKKYERNLSIVNNAYSITLHYDNTTATQANVIFEAYEVTEEYWEDSYTYFYARPILVFAADNSRYTIEDYFDDEDAFGALIEKAGNLAGEFENMVDRYF